jgi:hypothetical protein
MSHGGHLRDEDLLGPLTERQDHHLRSCPSCKQRRATQERVRAEIGELEREAPPHAAATALLDQEVNTRRPRWPLAFAAALVLVGVATVWGMYRPRRALPPALVDELALDHLHYEHKVDAAAVTGDPASISSWFGERLGFTPHLGTIEAVTIEGAKPCRIAGRWTALVWFDRAGHWLSLFTMPEQTADGRGCATAQGVRVCASPDPQGGARVLVGDLPEPEMMRLVAESLQ